MPDEKIYAISDLHVDHKTNMRWVQELSNEKYLNDIIIIPGDITHILSKLTDTLKLLKSKFKEVYFCPGNHELWTRSQNEDEELQIDNSIEKFHYILKLCDDLGVRTKPGITSQGVTIIPLYGWYDDSLHIPIPGFLSDLKLWTDSYLCIWPNKFSQGDIARYFINLNKQNLSCLKDIKDKSKIITFSHFLTSKDLMEAYCKELISRRLMKPQNENNTQHNEGRPNIVQGANFTSVAGTYLLGEQLKLIKPQVHIFGHSHRKMVLDIGDGIKYINNPLGNVAERQDGSIEPPYEPYEIDLTK